MRAFADPSTFIELPFGEQLMLWAMRLWMRGLRDGTPDQAILRTGFKLAGVPDAHPALDGLMTIITTAATDTIDIRCPQCADISADEHPPPRGAPGWNWRGIWPRYFPALDC